MMKKINIIVLFAALGTLFSLQTNAQTGATLPEILGGKQYDENKIYEDENGTYRYETREKRVWVPEQETRGIFGPRIVPGHYETVREQVKIYINRSNRARSEGGYYDQNGVFHPAGGTYNNADGKQRGWEGKHPHGMPPGQRKKMERNGNYEDSRYDSRQDFPIQRNKKDKDGRDD